MGELKCMPCLSAAAADVADAQLQYYANDLRELLQDRQRRAVELESAKSLLQTYARDLRVAFEEERRRSEELRRSYYATLMRLAKAASIRDRETGTHLRRIAVYSKLMGVLLGWPEERIDLLVHAAPLHDVGKIGISDQILLKPGPLDYDEWRQMERHTVLGGQLLAGSRSPLLKAAEMIALNHHERWDGTGYPNQLAGEEIPEMARLVMLVDNYDALRSKRPYKAALDHSSACEIILSGDNRSLPSHFDPAMLKIFKENHKRFDAVFRHFQGESPDSGLGKI